MAYGIQNLRRSAIYDQLTPGSGGSGERTTSNAWDVDNRGSYSNDDQGPVSRDQYGSPTTEEEQEPASQPGLAKLADVSVNPNKGQDTDDELRNYLDTVQGAYKPETRSRDRNDNLLDSYPQRGQPTKTDRAIAIMMSLGQKDALDIQEKVLQAPYYRDKEEWKDRTKPFYDAAALENTSNTNQRQVLGQAVTGYNYGRRTDATIRGNDQKYELGRDANRIKEYAINNPDMEIDFDGPNVIGINPRTGVRKELGPSGRISERERLTIIGDYGTERARIAARAQTDSAQIRANAPSKSSGGGATKVGYDDDGNAFYWDNNTKQWTDETKQGLRPNGVVHSVSAPQRVNAIDTPKEIEGREQEVLRRIHRTGAVGSEFIKPLADGTYRVDKPKQPATPWGQSDYTAAMERYNKLMETLYPDQAKPAAPPPAVEKPGVGPSRPPVSPTSFGGPTTSITSPLGPNSTGNVADPALRARAKQQLILAGKPPTDRNIDYLIKMKKVR